MKNITIVLILLGSNFLYAQNIVKNFTTQDISGNEISLNDQLNQGKAVILDFSTTWCSPCWDYHESHNLEKTYLKYGPEGTDELSVFFIESDPATGLDHLLGNAPGTKGNWIDGTTYPIIDNHVIQKDFFVISYPTIITVCPDRRYYISDRFTPEEHYDFIQNNCFSTSFDVDVSLLKFDSDSIVNCTPEFTPVVEIVNLNGNADDIRNLKLTTFVNDVETSSMNWEGHLKQYHTEIIKLPLLFDLKGTVDVKVEIEMVGDQNIENNVLQENIQVNVPIETSNHIDIEIFAGQFPSEITWRFVDNSSPNEILKSGSPTKANGISKVSVFFDKEVECLEFHIEDFYGKGNEGDLYYKLTDGNSNSVICDIQNPFGFSDSRSLQITEIVSSKEIQLLNEVNIFPNPTDQFINIQFNNETPLLEIAMYNIIGEIAYKSNDFEINSHYSFKTDISQNGIYFLLITTEKEQYFRKIQVTH